MNGMTSLTNFYRSVAFDNPKVAELMSDDIADVALYGLSLEKGVGQAAADRLRRYAFDLPEIQRRVLESALTELGYS